MLFYRHGRVLTFGDLLAERRKRDAEFIKMMDASPGPIPMPRTQDECRKVAEAIWGDAPLGKEPE